MTIVKKINNIPLAKSPILCRVTKPHAPAVKSVEIYVSSFCLRDGKIILKRISKQWIIKGFNHLLPISHQSSWSVYFSQRQLI